MIKGLNEVSKEDIKEIFDRIFFKEAHKLSIQLYSSISDISKVDSSNDSTFNQIKSVITNDLSYLSKNEFIQKEKTIA